MFRIRGAGLTLCLLLAMAHPARPAIPTTGIPPGPESVSDDRIARGDALHEQFRPLEALELFEEVLESDPASYDALWRAARETVSLGMLAAGEDDSRRWYVRGEDFGRRAVEAGPGRTEGHLWLTISLGRRALGEGARSRVRLAEEIRAGALQILDLEPENPGGHHVLGQWNAEVMRMTGISRWAARRLLGGSSFHQASWEAAVAHLTRATEGAPETLIHHFELARVHLDLGAEALGRASLREVMDRPALEPVDPMLKQQALEILKRL
jgi:regulator of microtubule dynamics protein 3